MNWHKYWDAAFAQGIVWKGILAAVASACAWLFPIDAQANAAIGCLALVVLDYLTGILASIRNGKPISSRRMRESILKPLTYMILLLATAILSNLFEVGKRLDGAAMTATLMFIAATEAKSLVENLIKAGVKVPPKLRNVFEGVTSEDPKFDQE